MTDEDKENAVNIPAMSLKLVSTDVTNSVDSKEFMKLGGAIQEAAKTKCSDSELDLILQNLLKVKRNRISKLIEQEKYAVLLAENFGEIRAVSFLLKSALPVCPSEISTEKFILDIYCLSLLICAKNSENVEKLSEQLRFVDFKILGFKCFKFDATIDWFCKQFDLYKSILSFDRLCSITESVKKVTETSIDDVGSYFYKKLVQNNCKSAYAACWLRLAMKLNYITTDHVIDILLQEKLSQSSFIPEQNNPKQAENFLALLEKSTEKRNLLNIFTKILMTNKYNNEMFQEIVKIAHDGKIDVNPTIQKAIVFFCKNLTKDNLVCLSVYCDFVKEVNLVTGGTRGLCVGLEALGKSVNDFLEEYIKIILQTAQAIKANIRKSLITLITSLFPNPKSTSKILKTLKELKLEDESILKLIHKHYHEKCLYSLNFVDAVIDDSLLPYKKNSVFGTIALDKRNARERNDKVILEFLANLSE